MPASDPGDAQGVVAAGAGRARALGPDVTALAGPEASVLIVTDARLAELGLADGVRDGIEAGGHSVALFSGITGEPKESAVEQAIDMARSAGAVVALGGGSALDAGKVVASFALHGRPLAPHRLAATDLPGTGVPAICVPTTAGTGSEATSTSVLSGEDGTKYWFWGEALKAARIVLDPELSVGLPPRLTAMTGLDALVHAIEAATCTRATPEATAQALEATRLIVANLAPAVREPGNLAARGAMLEGALLAGRAIDGAGTALAHNVGHALGSLAPVPHGHAVALAMAATLDWVIDGEPTAFDNVAQAMGAGDASDLPAAFDRFIAETGFDPALPPGCEHLTPSAVAERMAAPENAPMLKATRRVAGPADLETLAARTLTRGNA